VPCSEQLSENLKLISITFFSLSSVQMCERRAMILRRAISSIGDLIFPPRCALCGAGSALHGSVCSDCDARIIRISTDAHFDLPWRVWIARARSCFAHEEPVRHALWSLKYEGIAHSMPFFIAALIDAAKALPAVDLVVPVPMQAQRLIRRGIDPQSIFARSIAGALGVRCDAGILCRAAGVRRQVGLAREERMRNVRSAYSIRPGREARAESRRILIVDDVMTTGATLNECARALMKAGAVSVDSLTVARAI
jgi:ComF family protein